MGTSASISVKGHPIQLYVHYDGYPDGIMPMLKRFLETWHRGDDLPYCMAQLVMHVGRERGKPGDNTGFGLEPISTNLGVNYTYVVDPVDKTVSIK